MPGPASLLQRAFQNLKNRCCKKKPKQEMVLPVVCVDSSSPCLDSVKPSPFPILRLPLLALEIVVRCWDPVQMYQFSTISRKTQRTTIRLNIPMLLEMKYEERCVIQLSDTTDTKREFFIYIETEEQKTYRLDRYPQSPNDGSLSIICSDPHTVTLDLMRKIQKGFRRWTLVYLRIENRYFGSCKFSFHALTDWIESLEQTKISHVHFTTRNCESFGIFLQHFRKNTDFLELYADTGRISDVIEFFDLQLKLFNDYLADWIGPKQLKMLDFTDARIDNLRDPETQYNTFLKNWIRGIIYTRMKKCVFNNKRDIDFKIVFDRIPLINIMKDHGEICSAVIRAENGITAKIRVSKTTSQSKFSIHVL